MKRKGMVYLVGAGPGEAGLLTLRAAELLARADVVVCDAFASAEVRGLAPGSAERRSRRRPRQCEAASRVEPVPAGALASSHNVYFGTNPTLGAGDLQGNQAGTSFSPICAGAPDANLSGNPVPVAVRCSAIHRFQTVFSSASRLGKNLAFFLRCDNMPKN